MKSWLGSLVIATSLLCTGCSREGLPTVNLTPRAPVGQQDSGTSTGVSTSAVRFTPPNPNRSNPFTIFGLEGTEPSDEVISQAGTPNVTVYGFAEIEKQRAVLSVEGKRCSLAVNEQALGIRVVKIDPPMVTMQCGNFVWTASMFDQQTPKGPHASP